MDVWNINLNILLLQMRTWKRMVLFWHRNSHVFTLSISERALLHRSQKNITVAKWTKITEEKGISTWTRMMLFLLWNSHACTLSIPGRALLPGYRKLQSSGWQSEAKSQNRRTSTWTRKILFLHGNSHICKFIIHSRKSTSSWMQETSVIKVAKWSKITEETRTSTWTRMMLFTALKFT